MKIKIISLILFYIIRLLSFTYRYRFIGIENKEIAKKKSPNNSFIYAVWHQNLIGAILSHMDERFTMIISESKDGELVAVTCEKFGHLPARGSSTRGGKRALVEIVQNIKKGFPGALTVDGPKGPARVVKGGVVEIARLSESCILPLSPYPSKYWSFAKSWDQFRVPKPFSTIVVVIGEPIEVGHELKREDFDQLALKTADKINQGEEQAKQWLAQQS